jgi:hypothetical protein
MNPSFLKKSPFDREGSTLGVMDDIQIAVHSYDGCARGCPGCVVDKHFKNQARGESILTAEQQTVIHSRVLEYFEWAKTYLNNKEGGYFGKDGFKVNHFSYTFRFGNHSELPLEELVGLSNRLDAPFKVFSTAPTEDVSRFVEVKERTKGRFFLEIIYDPVADDAHDIRQMILNMRKEGILGYPEVLITRRLLDKFTPEEFVEKAVAPLGDIGTQMQFGRYSPSKTRSFNTTQVVPLDEEVVWLTAVAKHICERNLDIHPIPIGEYAVTFLDEYRESEAMENGVLNLDKLPELPPIDWLEVKEKTKDIFLSSLYIDHDLNLFVWSESMGQHVLDTNFGFPTLGNIREHSIESLVMAKNGVLDKMLTQTIRHLMTHKKCGGCRYQSFCASHAIPFFRKWHQDDGEHCYGYLPTIREFQKHPIFLKNMVDGFKALDF